MTNFGIAQSYHARLMESELLHDAAFLLSIGPPIGSDLRNWLY
jgi:hypothetical protein